MNYHSQTYLNVLLQLLQEHSKIKNDSEFIGYLKEVYEVEDYDLRNAIAIVLGQSEKPQNDTILYSIFKNLNKKDTSETGWLPLSKIDLNKESCFPIQTSPINQDEKEWLKGFSEDVESIHLKESDNLHTNVETFLFVLQKWTSNLASGYGSDIPFYDFAKLTAAVYVCLQKGDKEKPFLFVSGGVSGIQGYLYDIVSKNAAKNLKGRSFYLHVLVEAILFKILKKLELSLAHVVYSSGGNFSLIVPHTPGNVEILTKLKGEIADSLFATHHISMYSELNWIEVCSERLKNEYPSVCADLADKISEEKRHKFDRQIQMNCERLFEPFEVGGEIMRDVITNEEIPENKDVFILGEAIPDLATDVEFKAGENLINLKSAYQIKLGFGLKSAAFYSPTDWIKIRNRKDIHFPVILGIEPNLNNQGESLSYDDYEFTINETKRFLSASTSPIKGFQFYGGNDYPKIKLKYGTVAKTFSEMAGKEETDTDGKGNKLREYPENYIFPEAKFKRLAVLRMDVDGLGTIFRNGLPSLATHSTLSRNLDWFFKGYLNILWKGENKVDDLNSQIIYSGGDDLFIVGRWSELIAFAEKINTEFKEFVCEHEKLTISGGIALVTAKFPVIKAAKYAGEAEDEAKKYKFRNGTDIIEKNAFSMMGVTMNWDNEFPIVKSLQDKIVGFIQNTDKKYKEALPTSFIFKVNGFYETVEQNQRNKVEDYRWVWQMAYDLTRMKERIYDRSKREEEQSEIVYFLKELVSWTISRTIPPSVSAQNIEYFTFFRLLNLACIWASYELRNKTKIDV